ncbi:peptidoglycan D,D-transpeptidase FtsI family protein [Salinisphaera orenii]|uniref:Peptidoglycan D,D-transpeptidase FtsI n=1 Tax=Salinisphaera orenii YIM 95161 TaxID=1051139 RepID=A0A423QB10_9GAMM|nr:penicillin-binding protein 2 [Salinisphaera halophila]ROO37664.1 peptidoglycan glycosyltransferase [Salinisphaera halophila YIM 95161]
MSAPRRNRNTQLPPPARWRGGVVLGAFALFALVLAGRAFDLQVLDQAFLAKEGDKRHLRTVSVPAGRGAIEDRNGEPLALSAPTESVWAVPGAVLEAPEKLPALAKRLNMSTADLRKRLEDYRGRQFLYLRRQLSPSDARSVMNVDAPGIFLQREYKRYYPAGEAAAQIVGMSNIDGRGQEGLELDRNEFLDGEPGSRRVIKDRLGRTVEDVAEFEPPQPGHDLRLTLDSRLQYLAYRHIKSAVVSNDAAGGLVVMLDPSSGELRAVASYPSFNPNDRDSIDPAGVRARAATDVMEPGSTVKPILLSGALDSGLYDTDDEIETKGWFQVGRLTVQDYRDYGDVDFAKILQKSSNVGAAHVGLKMGAEQVWRTYHKFGFGQTSGTRFPGERYGVLEDFYGWNDVETAVASYGYGLSITALQLVRAYGAIADDGMLRSLRLIQGEGAQMHAPPERVISAETARAMRRMLEGVVSPAGTASRAAIPGYRVAGKTGTARKAGGGGYNSDRHQALFVGMAPAEDPALVTLVMLDEPKKDEYYGGAVAAPVFAAVMRDALRILRVPPDNPAMLAAKADDGEAGT